EPNKRSTSTLKQNAWLFLVLKHLRQLLFAWSKPRSTSSSSCRPTLTCGFCEPSLHFLKVHLQVQL
ncbi:unnamed protein product, partial [Oikopleura dioica]